MPFGGREVKKIGEAACIKSTKKEVLLVRGKRMHIERSWRVVG